MMLLQQSSNAKNVHGILDILRDIQEKVTFITVRLGIHLQTNQKVKTMLEISFESV